MRVLNRVKKLRVPKFSYGRIKVVSARNLVTCASFEKLPLRSNPLRSGVEMIFIAKPLNGESLTQFIPRVRASIEAKVVNKTYANHKLIISYPARIARNDENLSTAASTLKKDGSQLPDMKFMDRPILTGHCLMGYVNEQGQLNHDLTVSLRPDMSKSPLYRSETAPDRRLPSNIGLEQTVVRPVRYSSIEEELQKYATDAFYVHYVHRQRPYYALHCLLKPMAENDCERYQRRVQQFKSTSQQYSLLDHLHPTKGKASGDIVAGENCTQIARLFSQVTSDKLKTLLGDNPTPQLVSNVVKKISFFSDVQDKKKAGVLTGDDDELNKRFKRE
jgi:hypothetical protein